MADLNELKPVGKLNPFAKFCCTIGNLPTSYMISLTYEEQLLWLCKYLEDTVIPAVNTNAEAIQELQELYVVLKNYVDNYFENLDVQEEINNKLDEMAEDGTLQSIIEQYFTPLITPEYFGAVGDGVTDDSEAIQDWLDAHINNKNYIFDISSKTYAIGTGLNINYEEEDYLIDFKNATIKALNNMNYMLSVNTVQSDVNFGTDISDKFRRIKGGHWEGENKAINIILYRSRKTKISDMHLKNAKEIYVKVERGSILFSDSFLDRRNYDIIDSVGIYISANSSDSKIINIQARDIKTFTLCGGGSIFYINCHAWLVNILIDTIYCEYSSNAFFIGCYADTYNTVFKAFSGSAIMWTNGTLFWNTSLLPQNYPQPIILEHGEDYTGNINVYFNNTNFDLYNMSQFGVLPKYFDSVPLNTNNIAKNDNLLNLNRINPDYRNRSIETMTSRNASNGEMTFSEVRYVGNGFMYVKGIFRNDLGQIDPNYGFAQITQNNVEIAETSYLNGVVYNSSSPNNKQPIVIDVNQYGYLHTFVTERINNIDRIEFSGLVRINLLQGF